METDWDLQAVPIASKTLLPGMFPRLGTERMLSNPLESVSPVKANLPSPSLSPVKATLPSPSPALTIRVSENLDPYQKPTFCPQCSVNYERDLAKLVAIEKSFTQVKQDAARPSLPQWMQNTELNTIDESHGKDQEQLLSKQKTEELQRKWRQTCLNLHPNFHQTTRPDKPVGPPAPSMTSSYNLNLLARPPFQPKIHIPLAAALQLNTAQAATQPTGLLPNSLPFEPKLQTPKQLGEARHLDTNTITIAQRPPLSLSPPSSPVRTDLILGTKGSDLTPEKTTEDQAKDFLGCISSEPQTKTLDKFSNSLDADTYKKLLKGLMEKAWWQAEATVAVASAITRCRLGNGKRSRGDIWLLFTGPDRVGKKKMAMALAENMCGASFVIICLGPQRDDEDSDSIFRGKTGIDRIAEAIRRNPFSVVMLKDIDEADVLLRINIKRAMERGKLTDSHGREVGLGNAIFIITGDWSTTNPEALRDGTFVDEKKLASTASGSWQLGLIVREKSAKRRASWLLDESRQSRPRNEVGSGLGLSLDLNLAAAYIEDDKTDDRSYNSSDLTVEHGDELNGNFLISSVPHELVSNVEESIAFKPVDAGLVRREIKKSICMKFSMVVDDNLSMEIGDDVLEKILGGLWHDRTSLGEWIENVVGPSFEELLPHLPAGDRSNSVVRLVVESDSCDRGKSKGDADWLPDSILV